MLHDPIAALATPPGRSALAVVRVSGTGAFAVAERVVLDREALRAAPSRMALLATFIGADGSRIDRGLVTLFRAPHSYTGDDLAEFSCHGGLLVPAQLLAALHEAGARPAAPGEFTRRALLNGKLDLLQAEGIADLVEATARAQGKAALHQVEGGLSRRIAALRGQLLDLLGLLTYDIDFPGEDDGPVARAHLLGALEAAREATGALLATAPLGERLRAGALVVLAGRPNAGKSSLFNALLGTSRALVTPVPGTTRDAIEAPSEVSGWPIRLVDTAGLNEAPDPIERLGMEVSRRWLEGADLVLLCVEAGLPLAADEAALLGERSGGALLVRTKADLHGGEGPGIPVSSVTGAGLDDLRAALAAALFAGAQPAGAIEPMLTRERHRVALTRAAAALDGARPHLGDGGDATLAAHHVRDGVSALEELIGVVHPDEILDRVFARFCVGK